MRTMKKNIFLVLLIGLLFYLTNINSPEINQEYKNNYSYALPENSFLVNFNIINDNLYYITEKNNNSLIYLTNLITNETKLLKELNSSCFIEDSFFICNDKKNINIYNINLDLLYTHINQENINIFPYKDTFLKLENNNLYLKQQEEIIFKILEPHGEYKNYYYTKNNTYLLFIDYNNYKSYIYDIKNNSYQEINYHNYFKYSQGFCFYNQEKIYILDLKDQKKYEIPNPLNTDFYYGGTLDSNILYLYDSNNLIAYNIQEETIKNLNLNNYNINNLIKYHNYLYYSYDNKILSLNLETNQDKSLSLSEYKTNIFKELETYTKSLSKDYNLNIYFKELIKNENFTTNIVTDHKTIYQALEEFKPILNKFSPSFFTSFQNITSNKLNIYLTGKLTPTNIENEAQNPVAYSLNYNDNYNIVIDITSSNLKQTLCHELMHNIEFSLKDYQVFIDWSKYNPPSFTYTNSYNTISPFNFTLNETNPENIYFIDKYSHTYPEEDRARIFENICAYQTSPILDYSNLTNKAQYLKKEVLKYYPNLTEVFKSIT